MIFYSCLGALVAEWKKFCRKMHNPAFSGTKRLRFISCYHNHVNTMRCYKCIDNPVNSDYENPCFGLFFFDSNFYSYVFWLSIFNPFDKRISSGKLKESVSWTGK
jgi:hypothetical protein